MFDGSLYLLARERDRELRRPIERTRLELGPRPIPEAERRRRVKAAQKLLRAAGRRG